MRIVADENVPNGLIQALRANHFEVYSIKENHAGVSDEEVVTILKEREGAFVTEDKGFGERVFASGAIVQCVILLRYTDKSGQQKVFHNLFEILKNPSTLLGKFYTITENKIRHRSIL